MKELLNKLLVFKKIKKIAHLHNKLSFFKLSF